MKTSEGYTTEEEASKHGKVVVWYRTNPTALTFYVPFNNLKDAKKFAKSKGQDDPLSSPREAGICE